VDKDNMSLLTDLYELTMCASYFDNKRTEPATFDLFIRKLPPNRSYYMAAGLEQALLYLKNIKFSAEQIDFLKEKGFKQDFLDYLREFKFTGEVWAVPEGTIIFPNEPLIRITAPIIEAQLVESFLLNTINLQTMLATKASRIVHAACGKGIVEFGLRRTHGVDAAVKAARCSYIAGCAGTSGVLAGLHYGIPIFGTMAHSFIMFFDNEVEAFKAFVETFPKGSTLLIDTYDNIKGAENAAKVAKLLEKKGFQLGGVRIDSGDLVEVSKKVRKILDKKGLGYVKIFASGDLDEYKIDDLLRRGAKIDSFGVGTRMSTSQDRPYVDVIYKLCEKKDDAGNFVPTMKLSQGKITIPTRKQIYRVCDKAGNFVKDIIALHDEKVEGTPLLSKVMDKGEIICTLPPLQQIRKNALENLSSLPEKYKRLKKAARYPVELSPRLKRALKYLTRELRKIEGSA
jgi:nicotinate phosphoribosyltransferase